MRTSFLSCLALLCSPLGAWAADAYAFQAQTPVTNKISVPVNASPQTRANAEKLADLLHRITSVRFVIEAGDGTTGIALGRADDFPALQTGVQFDAKSPSRREEYLIRTHTKGIWLLGATEIAAQNAMWDLLHRLGYRHFFPGDAWEVIPRHSSLQTAIDTLEKPSYLTRRIWYGYGMSDYAVQPYKEWCEKNRCVPAVELNTGHVYENIINSHRLTFESNPDFLPLIDGQRQWGSGRKPELGNPKVRELFARHAVLQFHLKPLLDSFSMDPSDGGGWSESPESAALGSVSDQVLTLANEVAAAVEQEHPDKRIGVYAYNYHSPPPSLRVHPNVVVSVATAFVKGGYTVDELMAGWAGQGATLGVREYYSVNTWDRDQPAHARGGNLDYLQRTIPHFHRLGARYMSAEASDNWGPNGLGYWFATRALWDVREAARKDELVDDFLTSAFGPAKAPMRVFYEQLDGSRPKLVADDQIGRMHRALTQAHALANTPAIQRRINELTLYAHYASLYHRYARAQGAQRQDAFEQLIRHAWRMRKTMLVHTRGLYRDLPNRDKTVTLPPSTRWEVEEGVNPWKSSQPYAEAEYAAMRQEGTERHPLVQLNLAPRVYSAELAPAGNTLPLPANPPAPSDKPGAVPGNRFSGRGTQEFLTHIRQVPATLELSIRGGLIPHYRNRGNVRVALYKLGGASQTGEAQTLVDSDHNTPPDGQPHRVTLRFKEPGLHKVVVTDGQDRTEVTWPDKHPLVIHSTVDQPMNSTYAAWAGYFYVPKGTRELNFFGGEHGELLDADDRVVFWLNGREDNFYGVDVPTGQDGRFWRVRYVRGPLHLLSVPPYFGRSPQELLLPRSVLLQDGKR